MKSKIATVMILIAATVCAYASNQTPTTLIALLPDDLPYKVVTETVQSLVIDGKLDQYNDLRLYSQSQRALGSLDLNKLKSLEDRRLKRAFSRDFSLIYRNLKEMNEHATNNRGKVSQSDIFSMLIFVSRIAPADSEVLIWASPVHEDQDNSSLSFRDRVPSDSMACSEDSPFFQPRKLPMVIHFVTEPNWSSGKWQESGLVEWWGIYLNDRGSRLASIAPLDEILNNRLGRNLRLSDANKTIDRNGSLGFLTNQIVDFSDFGNLSQFARNTYQIANQNDISSIILDVSGSMLSHQKAVRKLIDENFPDVNIVEINGCDLQEGSATLTELCNHAQTGNVLWISDLQDTVTEAALIQIEQAFDSYINKLIVMAVDEGGGSFQCLRSWTNTSDNSFYSMPGLQMQISQSN